MVLQKKRREEQRTKRPFPQHKHKKKKEKQLLVDRRQVFPLHRHSLHRVPYHNFITVPQSYTGTEVDSLKGLLFLCHVVCVRLGRGRAKPKKGAHHVTGEESKTARSWAFKDNLRCNVESKATPIATCDCCPTPGDSGGGRGPHFCHCRVVMRMADILHSWEPGWGPYGLVYLTQGPCRAHPLETLQVMVVRLSRSRRMHENHVTWLM